MIRILDKETTMNRWLWVGALSGLLASQAVLADEAPGVKANSGPETAFTPARLAEQRLARQSEIDYYTNRYDGGKLQAFSRDCPAPVLPELSKTNAEIQQVSAQIQAWVNCYNAFAKSYSELGSALRVIPKDLMNIMNEAEVNQAIALIDKTLENISLNAKAIAAKANAEASAWKRETQSYVLNKNAQDRGMTVAEYEIYLRTQQEQMNANISRPSNDRSTATKK